MKLSEIRELQEKLEYEYYKEFYSVFTKDDLLAEKQNLEAEIAFALDAYYEAEDTDKEDIAWSTYCSVKILHRVELTVIDDIIGGKISQVMTEFLNPKTGDTTLYFGGEN